MSRFAFFVFLILNIVIVNWKDFKMISVHIFMSPYKLI
jgi:hypothetical protein